MLDVDELSEKPNMNTFNSVLAGLIGGLAGLAVGHPFDTVKVRLQSRELASKYKGTLNCFMVTIKEEKLRGLYKGMASPAVGAGAMNALVFGSYTHLMQYQASIIGEQYKESSQNAPLQHVFLAGVGAGLISRISQVLSRSLKRDKELSGPQLILAGGLAGIAAWCSTYFADVVKTRIQSEPHRYKGSLDCIRRSYYEEGWRVFFRGLSPTLIRAFPSNAATFVAYTWTMNTFPLNQSTFEEALL
ncbi:hypothetical protein G6F56_004888 [Rhizopus delemar]|nr:hypothetical protein G6F56_004888 [Rhizopus delemar]